MAKNLMQISRVDFNIFDLCRQLLKHLNVYYFKPIIELVMQIKVWIILPYCFNLMKYHILYG